MIENFCAFILTHGRPDNVVTYRTLERQGYTGPVFIIIDNEDETAEQYYKNFGGKVIMFDKAEIAKTFDEGDNFDDRRTITYARNACFQIAKDLGFEYFIQLDDDYTAFSYKVEKNNQLTDRKILNLDLVFTSLLEYFKSLNVKSIAMAQGGDFIGGINSSKWVNGLHLIRKCMNTFICSTSRQFTFYGRFNEDVNTYTTRGSRGELFLTVPNVKITQKESQSNEGGITDLYKKYGTYVKSFMTVMYSPSSVKVSMMGETHRRLHHHISWKNTVPQILDPKHKKC